MKIRQVMNDIHQIKHFRDLLDYLPQIALSRMAAILLGVWSLLPVLVLIRGITLPRADQFDEFLNLSTTIVFWTIFLTQIGLLGIGIGLICLAKVRMKQKKAGLGVIDGLKPGLPALLLLALLVWSLFSLLASPDFNMSWNGAFYRNEGFKTYVLYAGVFFCGLVIQNKNHTMTVLNILSATATLLSAVSVANIPAINNLFLIDANSSVFFNSNHYGYFLCMAMIIAIILLMMETRSRLFLTYRAMVVAVTTYALVINDSFGPFLAVICGILFCLICLKIKRVDRMSRFWLATGIFFATVIYVNLLTSYVGANFITLAGDLRLIISDTEDAGMAGSKRWLLWVNGLRFIAERPLFGYGPDNLGSRYMDLGIHIDRPHNIPIQLAASLGLPALIFYLSSLLVLAVRFFRQLKSLSLMTIGLAAAVITYFVSSLFGNSMFYTTPFYLMLLGMLNRQISQVTASDTDPDPGRVPPW